MLAEEATTVFLGQGCSGTFTNCGNDDLCRTNGNLRLGRPVSHPPTDELVVRELSQLSVGERQGIEEEIHGVAGDSIEETPPLIEESLIRMQEEIDLVRRKPAYDQALFLSPDYVYDRNFRLMFLRADRFEAPTAARRFIKHFEAKLFFWGQDLLCRDCTWDDLTDDDRAAVNTGSIWFSSQRDQSGRTIAWICQKLEKFANYKNQVRVCPWKLQTRSHVLCLLYGHFFLIITFFDVTDFSTSPCRFATFGISS